MKQGKTRQSILVTLFTQTELEVCDILLDLRNLIIQSNQNSSPKFPNWAITKKRSSKEPRLASASAPLPSHHSAQFQIEIKPKLEDKVQASSPATPLSFSPGESDEKPKHSSKKRGREEWMGIIEELTQSREILKGEVERVRNYYNQLQIHNTELKAWKQKILVQKEKDEEVKKMSMRKNGVNFGQQFGISGHQQQQYFVMNQYHHHHQYGQLLPSSSSAAQSASSLRQPIGPRGIPDLNVSAEEAFGVEPFQPLDHSTMIVTREDPKEKRLIRRIIRTKKRNEQRCK